MKSLSKKHGNKIAFLLITALVSAGVYSGLCFASSGSEYKVFTEEDSSKISIKGTRTGEKSVLSAEFLWTLERDFYYDDGQFNFIYGNMIPSNTNSDAELGSNTTINSEADPNKVGIWHGFDGINNRIILINRSNQDLYTKYNTTENTDNVGNNVDLQLLSGSIITPDSYQNVVKDPDNPNSGKFYPECLVNDTDQDKDTIFGTQSSAESSAYKIPAVQFSNGSGAGKMSYQNIYINITGKPSDDFARVDDIDEFGQNNTFDYQNLTGGSNNAIGTVTITLSANPL